MGKVKIYFLILFLFCIISTIEANDNLPYIDPNPGKITIMASTPIPHGVNPTHKAYEDLIECGFNLGTESGGIEYYKKLFDIIGDLNFKYLISVKDLGTEKKNLILQAFKDNSHTGGWYFKDEPNYNVLEELSKKYLSLYKEDDSHLIYMNLLGGLMKNATGPFTDYFDYICYIQNIFHPQMWSYDYYPFSINTSTNKLVIAYQQFYYDLECYLKISLQTSRPFWTYIQTMAFKAGNLYRPATNETLLRFSIFSSLAYGAQGIAYWTYGQRDSNENETYLSALVNKDGKKTKAWYAAKKVNGEIKRFNDVFYQCNVKEVRHTGDRLYKGTKKLTGEYGPFKMVRSGDAGVMVSLIENKGKEYVVIVSRDVQKKQKISLELKPNLSITDLTPSTPKTYSWRKDINLTLDKGGYVIFEVML